MFEHLNVKTRRIVRDICAGNCTMLGGATVGGVGEASRKLLAVLAEHLDSLRNLSGQELVSKVQELYAGFEFETALQELQSFEEAGSTGGPSRFRLGKIRACSFRGLAPAGRVWEHDFEGKSHLLYGPNGCGKSSLLGAICWCLTGRIFRDDRAPSEPERIPGYPADGESVGRVDRDDAQSLIDENGNSSSVTEPYWVQLQLIADDGEGGLSEVWLKRHSDEGLSGGVDGEDWTQISNIQEAGIDELDAELHLLMPARMSHLRFGKNPDLVHLLGEVVGVGELETVAEIAESLGRNCRATATRTETRELKPKIANIKQYIKEIKGLASESVKNLASYEKICGESRSKEDVKEFGEVINGRIDAGKTQLANDLGIHVPEEGTDEYKEWEKTSNKLPGQVHNLSNELSGPLEDIFASSIGLKIPSPEEIRTAEERLAIFEERAANDVKERLAWAKKELSDEKASLMLKAATQFPEGANNCPVCTQGLDGVPEVKRELEQLRTLSGKDYLQKNIDDFERALIAGLDEIVSANERDEGAKGLGKRVGEDWAKFKKLHCKDLLLTVAERFDDGVAHVAESIVEKAIEGFTIPAEYSDKFERVFSDYGEALRKAKKYLALCKSVEEEKEDVSKKLGVLLVKGKAESEEEAFKEILERAEANNTELVTLVKIREIARKLWTSVKEAEEVGERIRKLNELADSADPIRALKQNVRSEVISLVNGELGEKTKAYYELLYDNEVLEFEKLTTGHAGNPNIKDQVNLYLRAGKHQIPMGPYSNAGRMRALVLSFAFALLEKSVGSLGIVVLDDPATSLDDRHKARLVRRIIGSIVGDQQVVLATHYQRFYELSKPVFVDRVVLEMVPRRGNNEVCFEAGDLLDRIKSAYERAPGIWRELAGDLRTWIEKCMETLNGYSPILFRRQGDLVGSIRDYGRIGDPRIKGANQEHIVSILTSEFIKEIRRLCHDEDAQVEEFEDALGKLQECKTYVDEEVGRLKKLYQVDLEALAIKAGVQIQPLANGQDKVETTIRIVREAAAAHNEQGIEWAVNDEHQLEGCPVVLLRSDVISPVGLVGQYLILDWEDRNPKNEDFVVVEMDSGERYVRRNWWEENGTITLEGANPTKPVKPVRIVSGQCKVRRVVGVLYGKVDVGVRGAGEEWVPGTLAGDWFDDIVGVRVGGASLEPVARDGQIVLIEKRDIRMNIENDMLACVSVKNEGDFIKRCFVDGTNCILCAVNPTDRESPFTVELGSIERAYPLKGVLFEVGLGMSPM